MVISFSVSEARNQLLVNGIVYTYRWRRRAFFKKEKGEVEHTWANERRGKTKIADVDIHEIGQFDVDFVVDKQAYLVNSGFTKSIEWFSAIIGKQPPPIELEDGWLYKVVVKNGNN